ncbi:acyltransferase family protein [Porticoccus sp. Uisw_050_02]|uniref:acyltransferase family protein n=1 Tax=Porticoccus sp. Uisw_050_02 TaxID=3230978 RepID=UPI0039EBC096
MSSRVDNCFDEVRFILAFIVLVAHTSVLATAEQLAWFTGYFDSNFAVKGFFAISGYLVTKSYLSSGSYIQYFEKRIRRIYPAYVLVLIYCVIVGFLTTDLTLTEFVSNSQFVKYLGANLAFLNFVQPNLPGSIPLAEVQALNGSLWTIKVELMLYFTVPVLLILHKRIGACASLFICFGLGITWYLYFTQYFPHPIGQTISRQFPGQLPFFAFGSMLGFIALNKVSTVSVIIVSLIYFVLLKSSVENPLREIMTMFIYPFFVLMVAKSRLLSIGIGKFGDLSYGIYLFHFPTIQMLEHLGLYKFNPYVGFLASVVITITLAAFSWHAVEKRFLKRSSHYITATKIA